MNNKIPLLLFLFLAGCASGPAHIGPDTYMMSDTGAWSWSSGSNLKAGLYNKAYSFCAEQGKEMMPTNTLQNNANFSTFAHAEITFRCLSKNDPELARPNLQKTPDVIIQNK
jgi:putative hemolysin